MKCPICKKPVDEATVGQKGSTFPFCSPRCRDVDLGRWLDGAYQIPVQKDDDAFGDDEPDGTFK
ncbi:MAG TPA: DNA gyrase inhibitor YacG [Tepidisphaeraceae bacterium]